MAGHEPSWAKAGESASARPRIGPWGYSPWPARKRSLAAKEQRLAYILILPPLLIVAAVILFPVLWNFWLSFHKVRLLDLRRFSWWELQPSLDNFIKVLGHQEFWPALKATLIYTGGGTIAGLLMGLAAALLVNRRFAGKGFVRGLFLVPYMAPVVAVAFAWRFILEPRGIFMAAAMDAGILEQPIHLLGQRPWAMLSLIAFEGWRYFPFDFLFILARLQAIPRVLYEAAEVDGATPFQKFFHITLHQLRLVLATLVMLRAIWTFNKFDDVFLVTRGGAGTRVLTIKVYDFLIGEYDVGAGAAVSLVLFAILALFLLVYFRWVMGRAEEAA